MLKLLSAKSTAARKEPTPSLGKRGRGSTLVMASVICKNDIPIIKGCHSAVHYWTGWRRCFAWKVDGGSETV